MTDHEKRIRERIHGDDSLYTNVRNGDLRALLADLDAVRGALRVMPLLIECVKHQQWETALAFADQLDTALKGAPHD